MFENLIYPFNIKQFICSNGRNMAYYDSLVGDKTIIFVHGLSSYIPAFMFNIKQLKKDFRCIAVDLPGYGKSDFVLEKNAVTFFTNVLYDFINSLHLSNIILSGHSMGGQISINLTAEHTELIEKLILFAPAGIETFSIDEAKRLKENFTPENFFHFNEKIIRSSIRSNFYKLPEFAKFLISDWFKMKGDINYFDYCRVVCNSLYSLLDEPVYEKFTKIRCQTLLIFGKNDKLIPNPIVHHNILPEDIFLKSKNLIKNIEVVELENSGHFVHMERFEEVNRAIINFIH